MRERIYSRRFVAVVGMVLSLSTLVLYLPALRHSFVEYDDQQYVTENPHVQAGLTWSGVKWAFGFHASNWHPLTWLSHMLDCQIYGGNAGGHHLTNVLLHAASTLFLFLALNRLTGKLWRAAAVAALFAWHPLHVESVAWIAERKDVLCGFFWMLTLYAYVIYLEKKSVFRYVMVVVMFVLALMAKPMAVTLPFVLLLIDVWKDQLAGVRSELNAERRVRSAELGDWGWWSWVVVEKMPLFLLSVVGCWLTMGAQRDAIVSTGGLPIGERVAHTALAYWHYLIATFWPWPMAVYYPYDAGRSFVPAIVAGMGLVGITVLICLAVMKNGARGYARPLGKSKAYLLVGWLWFLGTLVPVIGLVQVGDQAWADRYTYLPLVGIFIAVVWGIGEFSAQCGVRSAKWGIAALVGAGMMVATSVQLTYWRNTTALFEHAYKVTHQNYMALTVLGSVLASEGKLDAAIADYRQAIKYKPGFPEAYFFLGNALEQQGHTEEAIADYRVALWFKPVTEQAHIFLGMILGKQNKYDEAAVEYSAALAANSDSAIAHNNLARILHTQGKLDEAIEHYLAALAIDPKLTLAQNNLGILLLQKGRTDEGVQHLREALRLKPGDAETEYNLALALNQQSQWSEAAELFARVVTNTSQDPNAHYAYGVALYHLQKTREAIAQYASALLIKQDFADALDGLSWILATASNADFRNGEQAVKMAQRACELTKHKNPGKLKTLAAAQGETGKFDEAVKSARAAMDLARAANNPELVSECQKMLEQFQAGKPWRG
ncbi:MAG TPA: tetratricopeptide repeat protein [Verrucomicrobiae bacterium]|jgi:tetratricopeptide (TPR) repeat protein|nr:tetratricopeptide repeat protein [Verrucomicrobiae bacterium]